MPSDPLLLGDLHLAGPYGRAAVIAAAAEIGVSEHPPGSNRGPRVDQYLGPDLLCLLRYVGKACPHCGGKPAPVASCIGAPWCARFARWCVITGASANGQPLPLNGWGGLASALKWQAQAKSRRSWIETPSPGRIGCMVREDGSGHVVLVARVVGDEIATVEGNEGNAVITRRRKAASMTGFVEIG